MTIARQARLFDRIKRGNSPLAAFAVPATWIQAAAGYSAADLPVGRWLFTGALSELAAQIPGNLGDRIGLARTEGGGTSGNGPAAAIFGGDGVLSCLRIAAGGQVSFERKRIVDARLRREQAADDPGAPPAELVWLQQQQQTRQDAMSVRTTAGYREPGNTSVYPLGSEALVNFEAGRPWRVDPATLATLGPLGSFGPGPKAPWFAQPGNPMPPTEFFWEQPGALGTAHPVIDSAGGLPRVLCCQYRIRGFDTQMPGPGVPPLPVPPPSSDRGGVGHRHRSRLYLVAFRRDATGTWNGRRIKTRFPGTQPDIGWSAHQIIDAGDWIVVADSGFTAEIRQWNAPGLRGTPSQGTVLWCVRKSAIWQEFSQPTPGGVTAFPVYLPAAPTIHGYSLGSSGDTLRLFLLSCRDFDASEWIRGTETLRGGSPLPVEARGLPGTDQSASGQLVYELTIQNPDTLTAPQRVIHLEPPGGALPPGVSVRRHAMLPGSILAAEPPSGASELFFGSQGTWPALDTVEQAAGRPGLRPPGQMRRLGGIQRLRPGAAAPETWMFPDLGWPTGLAVTAPDGAGRAWLFVALKTFASTAVDAVVVDQLLIFDTSRPLGGGPAFVIQTPQPSAGFGLGFNVHGAWIPA